MAKLIFDIFLERLNYRECAEQEPSPKALDDDLCNILYNYSIEGVDLPASLKYVTSSWFPFTFYLLFFPSFYSFTCGVIQTL